MSKTFKALLFRINLRGVPFCVQTAGKKVGKKNRKKDQRDPDAVYQEGG